MSDTNNELPGVVFRLQNTQVLGTATKKRKMARVTLDAEINDDAVWDVVKDKLKELKVYAIEDFKGELLNALVEEHKKLEAAHEALKKSYATMADENRQMKAGLSVLHHQLDR